MPSKKPQIVMSRIVPSSTGALTGTTAAVLKNGPTKDIDEKAMTVPVPAVTGTTAAVLQAKKEPLMVEGTPHPEGLPSVSVKVPPQGQVESAPKIIVPSVPHMSPGPSTDILHLSASVLLAPGGQASPNKQSLFAPNGKGMFVHEIKFDVALLAADNPSVVTPETQYMNFGAVIAAMFKLGDLPLTAQFVPLSMFSPCQKVAAEYVVTPVGMTPTGSNAVSQYSWRPDDPIYVPPGTLLEPMLINLGFLNYNLRVRISYAAKIADGRPSRSRLPYIAFWRAPNFIINGTETEQDSTEKDLVNLLEEPIVIDRFLGRVFQIYQSTVVTPGVPSVTIFEGTDQASGTYYSVLNQTKIRMTSSWGSKVIGDWVPWPAAFDMWSRAIEAKHEIPAGGYYIANVLSGSEVQADTQAMACIAIVGSREVTP
jgi:hypothetical protein